MATGVRRAGPGTWALVALAGGLLLMVLGWAVAGPAWRGDGAGYGWGVMPRGA